MEDLDWVKIGTYCLLRRTRKLSLLDTTKYRNHLSGFPIVGVVQALDFSSLDVCLDIVKSVGGRNPLIEDKVAKGHLGVKTSRGIYNYGGRSEFEITAKRDRLYLELLDQMKIFDPL
jgi:3-hydroxyacyl-CoA dehydrogenase